jgi:hypothetical protein
MLGYAAQRGIVMPIRACPPSSCATAGGDTRRRVGRGPHRPRQRDDRRSSRGWSVSAAYRPAKQHRNSTHCPVEPPGDAGGSASDATRPMRGPAAAGFEGRASLLHHWSAPLAQTRDTAVQARGCRACRVRARASRRRLRSGGSRVADLVEGGYKPYFGSGVPVRYSVGCGCADALL